MSAYRELHRPGAVWRCLGPCGRVLPITVANFKPSKTRRGHDTTCRSCRNDYLRKWRAELNASSGYRPWPKGRANQVQRVLRDLDAFARDPHVSAAVARFLEAHP